MARLSSNASGNAGEAAFNAFFLRAGLKVAKPYWTEDMNDLLVLYDNGTRLIAIPIQVKSVQKKKDDEEKIQRLWKRYLEKTKYLCLAIYCPDLDKLWFIPKADNIVKAYKEWASKPAKTKPRKKYDEIDSDKGEVPLRVNVTQNGDEEFDKKWLLNTDDVYGIVQQINILANEIQQDKDYSHSVGFSYIGQGSSSISRAQSAECTIERFDDDDEDIGLNLEDE